MSGQCNLGHATLIEQRGNALTIQRQGKYHLATISTNKIDNFIEVLNLPKGIAGVLFETVECCQAFFEDFYMRNKYLSDDLLDFREYKIEKSKKTLDLFLEECYNNNMRQAFESTFYQSFTESHIELVEQAISEGRVSLEQLFTDFKKNPNKNILKNVL